MALDLELIAIPEKLKYVLQKAMDNIDYAIDFDKITEPDLIKKHIQMIKANPDGTQEQILEELYEDSLNLIEHYPNKNPVRFRFYSKGRGYDTLNYLLLKYYQINPSEKFRLIDPANIFYSGHEINPSIKEHVRFQFWDNQRTSDFYSFFQHIEFSDLTKYYNFEEMVNEVYKLVTIENLKYLKDEFDELKEFYRLARELDSFVIINVN